MKRFMALLAGAFFFSSLPAHAAHVIRFSPGGNIGEFIESYEKGRESEAKYVIDGACLSACTLIVGIIPPENVCVTPRASLGFHSATKEDDAYSEDGTQILWHIYPAKVREMLKERGWDGPSEHPHLVWIGGDALRSLIRPCS